MENTDVTMKADELQTLIEQTAIKAAEAARLEVAKNTVPPVIGKAISDTTSIKVDTSNDHALGVVISAFGKSCLEHKPIVDVMKEIGKEPGMYFNPDRVKNQTAGQFDDGGALINEIYSTEFIPKLRAKSVFRNAGIPVVPMVNGQLTYREGLSNGTATWRGEAQKKTKTGITFGQKRLSSKYLDAVIVASDQSLRYATVNLAQQIENDLMTTLALQEDQMLLYGTGTSFTPLGIFNAVASANSFAMTGGDTSALRRTDLIKCPKLLAAANVNVVKPIWIMHPTNKWDLANRVDANSNLMDYSRTMSDSNILFGAPVFDTTQAYYSSAYNTFYIDLDKIFIAQAMGISLKFIEGGSYWDGTSYVSGQVTGESTFTASLEEDFGFKYTSAMAVITGTTWGV